VKRFLTRFIDYALYAVIAVLLVRFVSRKFSGPKRGAVAAAIDLPTVGDTRGRFSLAEHRGNPVLIEVFASWCAACRRSAPAMIEAWSAAKDRGVTFVGVSLDTNAEDAQRIQREWGIPYQVALDDGRMSKDYAIELLPTLILIDREGRVAHVSTGTPSAADVKGWLADL
jgi:thiol-disulfide isomerase/thioredoxin